ncbi:hypothetical protein PPYR_12453 [Photinus pyralis]|uniref:DUF19 domain-containing protein n=1 Tax=Photinus pyralis TaxID=7054 RepID=A0A5N4AE76_PHOPY|nr:uncharacterized protein LOC116176583 isoform X2 [Photinus pyralis]KAB0795614.1 hypothetical protein PPYR_12453 [Photinus pyralis]
MKSIALAIFLLLGIVNVKGDDGDTTTIWEDLLENKCKKAGIADPLMGFYETLSTTLDCLEVQNMTSHYAKFGPTEAVCEGFPKNVRGCFKVAVDNVAKCLETEEKYLPNFIFEALDNFIDLICVDKFVESLDKSSFTQCMKDISQSKFMETCKENRLLKSLPEKHIVIPQKSELCSDLKEFHDCFEDNLKQTCTGDNIAITLLNKLYKAISPSCNKEEETST